MDKTNSHDQQVDPQNPAMYQPSPMMPGRLGTGSASVSNITSGALQTPLKQPKCWTENWSEDKKRAMFAPLDLLDLPPELRFIIHEFVAEELITWIGSRNLADEYTISQRYEYLFWGNISTPSFGVTGLLSASKAIRLELQWIIFGQAEFRMTFGEKRHRVLDASRPELRSMEEKITPEERTKRKDGKCSSLMPGFPLTQLRHLHITLVFQGAGEYWLSERMKHRKSCVLFDEMSNLKTLDISLIAMIGRRYPTFQVMPQPVQLVEKVLFWLISAVPVGVTISFTMNPTSHSRSIGLSAADLEKWYQDNEHIRGTSKGIINTQRKDATSSQPDFMKAWTEERRQARKRAEASKEAKLVVEKYVQELRKASEVASQCSNRVTTAVSGFEPSNIPSAPQPATSTPFLGTGLHASSTLETIASSAFAIARVPTPIHANNTMGRPWEQGFYEGNTRIVQEPHEDQPLYREYGPDVLDPGVPQQPMHASTGLETLFYSHIDQDMQERLCIHSPQFNEATLNHQMTRGQLVNIPQNEYLETMHKHEQDAEAHEALEAAYAAVRDEGNNDGENKKKAE